MDYYKSVFISDTHLGTRRCDAAKLLDFLHTFRADNLYLVGDIIDMWEISLTKYFPQDHWNALRTLLGKPKHGTKVFYIPGNHDLSLKKLCPVENLGNINVVERTEYVTVGGKRLLLFHGDFTDRYLFFLKNPLSKAVADVIYHLFTAVDFLTKPFFPKHRPLMVVLQLGLVRLRDYSRRFENNVIDYARGEGYDGVICGHDHSPARKEKDGFVYMNCGDWVVNCTAIVEDAGGEFKLVRV